MIILGIDPGSIICGYGVIEKQGSKISLLEYGVVNAKKANPDFNERLKEIYTRLYKVIERNAPDEAAFESMFYSKNVQTLIKLSHARAAAILAATMHNTKIEEYAPREVKKSVTGNGAASKEQVQYMVKKLLNIKETPEYFDATDALAVAICHSIKMDSPAAGSASWADFIKKNPGRVVKS